jgi:hypothetical protein
MKITLSKIRRVLMRYVYLYSGISITVNGKLSFTRYFRLRKQLRLYKKQATLISPPPLIFPCKSTICVL